MPFGQVVPVTGLNYGFPGTVSRMGKRTIAARAVLTTAANPIAFGSPVVINPATDTYESVADFITGGGTFTAALFAGIAIREVTTTLASYPYSPSNPTEIGTYLQGKICEVLEEGSISVFVQPAATGTQVSQNPVFIRIATNASFPSAVVGGIEMFADGVNTVQLTGVVFRTIGLDANNVGEITILNRIAA